MTTNYQKQDTTNLLINGNMDHAQRGTSFVGFTGGKYVGDRWLVENQGGEATMTGSISTTRPNFQSSNSIKLEATTGFGAGNPNASSYSRIRQAITIEDISPINQKEFLYSFWIRSTTTGKAYVTFEAYNGVGANVAKYIQPFTVDASDTWEFKTLKIPAYTSDFEGTGRGMMVELWLAGGSNLVTGATEETWGQNAGYIGEEINLLPNNGDTVYFTQAMLIPGHTAQPFRLRSGGVDAEFALCERFCQKSNNKDVVPGTNSNGGRISIPSSIANGTTIWFPSLTYRTPMRATPVVTFWDQIGTLGKITIGSTNGFTANITWIGDKGLVFSANGLSGLTIYESRNFRFHYLLEAEI